MRAGALLFAILGAAAALSNTCKEPTIRREWRQLSEGSRQSYLKAVLCLRSKPSRLGLKTSLYEDFSYVHARLNNQVHNVASFLPWHRYFVHLYEQALQECGYKGVATYWDWTLDTDNVPGSSIWDAKSGFGGDGSKRDFIATERDSCVQNGPFKDMTLHYEELDEREHCLRRRFNARGLEPGDMLAFAYTPEAVSTIHQLPDYNGFRIRLETGPHRAVHRAIGGEMPSSTSPNDPIFFVHHTQIDRLWTLWQNDDPDNRNLDFSGIKTQDQSNGKTPPPASLEDVMPMMGLADDVAVRDYMSTTEGPLCYTY